MPFLQKIAPRSETKPKDIQRPLANTVKKTLDRWAAIHDRASDERIATIEVHDTISNVAWAYERLRNAIDYQDEHLLRKNAIERILKRRLVAGVTAEQVAEPLILELIRSRYLPNNSLPVTLNVDAAAIINAYVHLWSQVPTQPTHEASNRLFEFFIGLLSVQLNELLVPTARENALVDLMYQVTHRDIAFANEEISETDKNTLLIVAIHRALLKSDPNIIRYKLFQRLHPEWTEPDPTVISALAANFVQTRQEVERLLLHPVGDLLQRLMKKYAIIFLVFDDVVRADNETALERLTFPSFVAEDVEKAYLARKKIVQGRIARSIIRSIIYVFLTKMLLTLVVEVPLNRWFGFAQSLSSLPLLINVIFPPLLLAFVGLSIRVPGQKNIEAIIQKVQNLIYRGDDRNALVKPRKPIRRSALFTFLYRIMYLMVFLLVFGGITWGLTTLHFSPVDSFIFLLFLSIVSFFGIRVRLLSKELLVVDQRENIFTVLFDFITVPILQVGRWIALRAPKINVMIFFLDVIIEAPFKATLEAIEGFFGFLKEKREEIY